MSEERKGVVSGKAGPLTLLGSEVKVGQKAPDFKVKTHDGKTVSLAELKGKTKIIASVPSLDTPVCDQETRRFNQEAASLSDVAVLVVSVDLPMAQGRFCGAAGIDKLTVASDYYDHNFGNAYGTLIKENHLLARAVFVVDGEGKVTYAEYVPSLGNQPNFDAILKQVKSAVGSH